MFLPILLISVVFLGIALLGLGVQTFFSSKRKFPETEIGRSKAMREKGIYCMKTEQVRIDKGLSKGQDLDSADYSCCGDGCSV